MKALILAAGFGTRLLPYSVTLPKPLFTINCIPVIRYTIDCLIQAGCSEILINTHYLHNQIYDYISHNSFPIKIRTIFEPEILDTGGAVKNAKSYLADSDFFVINSDIMFDIDLGTLFKAHQDSGYLVSLVLHKHNKFNKIEIDQNNIIKNFNSSNNPYAFTGIQIMSSDIFNFMPLKDKFSIIDFYKNQGENNFKINALLLKKKYYWEDIGTIEAYKNSSIRYLTRAIKDPQNKSMQIDINKLAGDGSDREWFRVTSEHKTYIAADHGINPMHNSNKTVQLDSFVNIGKHLYKKGLFVPEIYNFDPFSGIAIVEDLGDTHLEQIVNSVNNKEKVLKLYKKVCDSLYNFSLKGFKNFDLNWTFETNQYSKELILQKECKYFIEAFVNTFLKQNINFKTFLNEFEFIAENCIDSAFTGLMHRDMQSKNIMVKNNQIFFIDFQSARQGPMEYDLASLLIDPYIRLDHKQKHEILSYVINKISINKNHSGNFDAKKFKHCYKYCCIARNFQILGAFSYLGIVKKKKQFIKYIPYALQTLKENIKLIDTKSIPKIINLIENLRL